MENAKFIISLDFELDWGVYDVKNATYDQNIIGARYAIPKILDLFNAYDISATWATVGMLFNKDKQSFIKYKPSKTPSYINQKLNSYQINIGIDEENDPYHYAYSLIKLIQQYPGQEIASHSYSHYYTTEPGQTSEEFREDIQAAKKIATDLFNTDIKSFVFPRNLMNENYLTILSDLNFCAYRGNPKHWAYIRGENKNFFIRVYRFIDIFFNLSGYLCHPNLETDDIKNIPASRFLRPFIKIKLFNYLMLNRIKSEMLYAAKNNLMYHLWWHPHNFGINTKENLKNLKTILEYSHQLKKSYNMQSVTMYDYSISCTQSSLS